MPTRISNGSTLAFHVIQLNGKLTINFVPCDGTPPEFYILQGRDMEFADYIAEAVAEARMEAFGELLRSSNLEMYFMNVRGVVNVRFEGPKGDVLEFTDSEVWTRAENSHMVLQEVGRFGDVKNKRSNDGLFGDTQRPCSVVSLREQQKIDQGNGGSERIVEGGECNKEVATTNDSLSKGVLSFFTTFDDPTPTLIRYLGPQSSFFTPYTASPNHNYKHIFLEGYRSGPHPSFNEEGRLHIDLANHTLLWESCDDYVGGTRLTLDRLDLPVCTVVNVPLEMRHAFSDWSLRLCSVKGEDGRGFAGGNVVFSMDYNRDEYKVWANDTGTGSERYYYRGDERSAFVERALEECLAHRHSG